MPFYKSISYNKTFGCLQLISTGFHYFFKIIFKNKSEFINFAVFVLFRLIVAERYY